MSVRKLQERRGWAFSVAVGIIKPTLLATTTRDWRHGDRIPASGGFVLALNHISHADPLTAAHIVYDHGRLPRYLAKSGLFRNPLLGRFMHALGQIPVEREGKGPWRTPLRSRPSAAASASWSTPRGRSPVTPTAGR
nr:1-acyl-sn-glycerol-3-phosphate acyltransferase [Nocardioides sp.]